MLGSPRLGLLGIPRNLPLGRKHDNRRTQALDPSAAYADLELSPTRHAPEVESHLLALIVRLHPPIQPHGRDVRNAGLDRLDGACLRVVVNPGLGLFTLW